MKFPGVLSNWRFWAMAVLALIALASSAYVWGKNNHKTAPVQSAPKATTTPVKPQTSACTATPSVEKNSVVGNVFSWKITGVGSVTLNGQATSPEGQLTLSHDGTYTLLAGCTNHQITIIVTKSGNSVSVSSNNNSSSATPPASSPAY